MKTYRTNAIVAGALYITGTVAGVLSLALSQPLRDAHDPLAGAAANAGQVTVAALLVIPAVATLLIASALDPFGVATT